MSDLLALPEVPMAVSGEVPEAEFLGREGGRDPGARQERRPRRDRDRTAFE